LCVRGRTGCGKSTLLKAVAGLLPVLGGQLRLAGPLTFVPERLLEPACSLQDFLQAKDEPTLQKALSLVRLNLAPDSSMAGLDRLKLLKAHLCRAVVQGCGLVLMDEPNVVLLEQEERELFGVMEKMSCAFIVVLHKQVEQFRFDRVFHLD
jgi:ABC-type cobalamin/Fe3+-siderophores transport system ATPase subunit